MAQQTGRLEVRLLGKPSLTLDGAPLPPLASRKVEAVFIFIVSNQHPHLREVLASLFFDSTSRRQAHNNLRVLLSRLRKEYGEFVTITRQTVTFTPTRTVWLDTAVFQQQIKTDPKAALALYKGNFLKGFVVRDCPGFGEWVLVQRERYQQIALESLHALFLELAEAGKYEEGLPYARRMATIAPLQETYQRLLVHTLALNGQKEAALAQYKQWCTQIEMKMNAAPSPQMKSLIQQLQNGANLPKIGSVNGRL